MLNTNNNTIKNSNGMNKKFFNLIFISFLFLGLLTLFSIQAVKAYQAGDVVSFSFTRVGCGTGNSSMNTNWYGTPAYLERKIIPPCVNGEVPMIITTKITSRGGCKVNGCGADPSLECVTLKHSALYTYTNDAKEPVGGRSMNEVCKKCHAEVVEVVEVGNYSTGPWRRVDDKLVAKNKCAKYKAGACDTPCPDTLTCPIIERDCAIEDRNSDGDAEDENDYRCVNKVATIATPIATAPIAGDALTAAPRTGGGAVLGVTNIPQSGAKCCDLVANNNFSSCPAGNNKTCCPKDYQCYWDEGGTAKDGRAVCCQPDETAVKEDKGGIIGWVYYCSPNENNCEKQGKKKCAGSMRNICCSKDKDGNGNDKYQCATFDNGKYAYCKQNTCPNGTTDECSGLCCQNNQKCHEISKNTFICKPKDQSQCDTASGQHFCNGEGFLKGRISLCCNADQACLHQPNDAPYCLKN